MTPREPSPEAPVKMRCTCTPRCTFVAAATTEEAAVDALNAHASFIYRQGVSDATILADAPRAIN